MDARKDVLIVDDDPDIVEALSMILEDVGYTTQKLYNVETLDILQGDLPGVILLDIWMSGMDGRDICRYLKSQPSTEHVPIILISANNAVHRIAKEVGANDCLAKPFDLEEVVEKVRKYLAP